MNRFGKTAVWLSAALFLVGCTSGQDEGVKPTATASAASGSVWLELKETPGGWLDMESTKKGAKTFFVTNFDGDCSYAGSLVKNPSKKDSVEASKDTIVSDMGEKAVLSERMVNSTAGELTFATADMMVKHDFDGDGKQNSGKRSLLSYVFPDSVDENGDSPEIKLSYTCNDKKDWDKDELNTLLSVTLLHVNEEA